MRINWPRHPLWVGDSTIPNSFSPSGARRSRSFAIYVLAENDLHVDSFNMKTRDFR
jgi:hypothetical protein